MTEANVELPSQNSKTSGLVRRWLASNKTEIDGSTLEDGLAMKLYRLCLEVLRDICQQKITLTWAKPSQGLTHVLKDELGKLYLWGEGFATGELDKALNHAEDLRRVVFKTLKQIGQPLLQCKSRHYDRFYVRYVVRLQDCC